MLGDGDGDLVEGQAEPVGELFEVRLGHLVDADGGHVVPAETEPLQGVVENLGAEPFEGAAQAHAVEAEVGVLLAARVGGAPEGRVPTLQEAESAANPQPMMPGSADASTRRAAPASDRV